MKQWVKKLVNQFDRTDVELSEDRATLLYLIDVYSKNLLELDSRPVRKVQEIFDEFAKGLVVPKSPSTEKLLFRFRQFFSAYRVEEYAYLQKTFQEFKSIIWDFADQLNDSVTKEQNRDHQVRESLEQLREAVEANSIEELKVKSREFIDFYVELQNKNDELRKKRLENVQQNLQSVKQKLVEVHNEARRDHLTGLWNRKSFDEHVAQVTHQDSSNKPYLITFDIDYFKKINDIFGHDAGDYVLKHLAKRLQHFFTAHEGFVARFGGEEFCTVIPNVNALQLSELMNQFLDLIRKDIIVHHDAQIRLTISAGIAQLNVGESTEQWCKRADLALYQAKNSGRDRYIFAANSGIDNAA